MSAPQILIIDDEQLMRSMLKQILEREHYEVHAAANGDDALELCHKINFELVITDILMPGKEGLETIAELRRNFAGVKIIAMSGGGDYDSLSAAQLLGARRTLAKPFSRQEIVAAVKDVLAGA